MKKPVVYLCTGMLVLGLAACGRNNEDDVQNNGTGGEGTQNTTQSQVQQSAAPEVSENPGASETSGLNQETTDLSMIREALVELLGENYWPNTQIPPEYLADYGLTPELYQDFYGEMPMISTNADTLIIIEAKDDRVEEVEEVLMQYREKLVNDARQYPMNVGKIQASRIETFGNYVCFVQLGADTTESYGEDGDEEAVIKHCQEQNELAIEAIGKALADR